MKRDWLLQRVPQIATTVLVTVVLLACATVVNAQQKNPDDKWRFTITPYLWLPSLTGSLKTDPPAGFTSGITDIGPGSYLENLQFAGMLDFQVQKGKWSLQGDIIYVDFSDHDRNAHFPGVLPGGGGWTVQADTGLKALVSEFAGAHSVFRNEHSNFDLLGGVRYANIDSNVSLNITGPLPAWVRSRTSANTASFVDPIVGFKGKLGLGKKWYLPYYFDIGGFSVDSDVTLQAYTGVGYRFSNWFSLGLGYRYLYYNFGDTKRVKDLNVYGGSLAFNFTF